MIKWRDPFVALFQADGYLKKKKNTISKNGYKAYCK